MSNQIQRQRQDQWLDRLQSIGAALLIRRIPVGIMVSTGAIDDLIDTSIPGAKFTLYGLIENHGDPALPLDQQSDQFRKRFAELCGWIDPVEAAGDEPG